MILCLYRFYAGILRIKNNRFIFPAFSVEIFQKYSASSFLGKLVNFYGKTA